MPMTRTRTRLAFFSATSTVSPSTTCTTRPEYVKAPLSRAWTSPASAKPTAVTKSRTATTPAARRALGIVDYLSRRWRVDGQTKPYFRYSRLPTLQNWPECRHLSPQERCALTYPAPHDFAAASGVAGADVTWPKPKAPATAMAARARRCRMETLCCRRYAGEGRGPSAGRP